MQIGLGSKWLLVGVRGLNTKVLNTKCECTFGHSILMVKEVLFVYYETTCWVVSARKEMPWILPSGIARLRTSTTIKKSYDTKKAPLLNTSLSIEVNLVEKLLRLTRTFAPSRRIQAICTNFWKNPNLPKHSKEKYPKEFIICFREI